jgi:DNA repair exonuclease SbcCD nuclease subunit
MDELTGRTIIFSDCHFGLKQNSISRLKIDILAFKEILKHATESDVKNIIFAGDAFHDRVNINSQTLNIAVKCFSELAKHCKVYLIVGNHDSFMKNKIDINSLIAFKNIDNVKVIDSLEEVMLNGQKVLLVPWLADVSKMPSDYDIMIGHFEVSRKYLIASYIADNKSTMNEALNALVETDSFLNAKDDQKEQAKPEAKPDDREKYIGSFIEHVKPQTGIVYAGHIHSHSEVILKQRQFIFIGSPFQQNIGDAGHECGFYILDKSNARTFITIDSVPKHVIIKMSDVLKAGIDKFDFSVISGNIIQKVYDVDVGKNDEIKIFQKINDYHAYEELLPEYGVAVKEESQDGSSNDQLQLIKKSKLEYVKSYIEGIDEAVLKEKKIDKQKLYSIMEKYYMKALEDLT